MKAGSKGTRSTAFIVAVPISTDVPSSANRAGAASTAPAQWCSGFPYIDCVDVDKSNNELDLAKAHERNCHYCNIKDRSGLEWV
jgi:hypothetical protein